MKCIDKECAHREFNGGDDISDFYFCKECGVSVGRGEDECLWDQFNNEDEEIDNDYPCHSCPKADFCDGWDAQFCCTLCHYYNPDPDCDMCNDMDI